MDRLRRKFISVFRFDKKNLLFTFFGFSLILAGFFASNILCFYSTETKIDTLSNKINNYYSSRYINNDTPPYMRVELESKKTSDYVTLFNSFYYSSLHSGFRMSGSNEILMYNPYFEEKVVYPVNFHFQPTNGILDKYEWGYYVDGGLFSSYYKDEVLTNRTYLNPRFDSDGFIYISDTLANKLLEKYGIDSYETLMLDPNYCLLRCEIGDRNMQFSINNILHTRFRTGPRVFNLEDDFCLFYSYQNILYEISAGIEMDLKSDIYGTSKILKNLNQLGFTKENSIVSFFTYDLEKTNYSNMPDLNNYYLKINFNDSFFGIIHLAVIIFAVILYFAYYLVMRNRYSFYLFWASSIVFLFISFVIQIINFSSPLYNCFSVSLLISILTSLILEHVSNKTKNVITEQNDSLYEIKI